MTKKNICLVSILSLIAVSVVEKPAKSVTGEFLRTTVFFPFFCYFFENID